MYVNIWVSRLSTEVLLIRYPRMRINTFYKKYTLGKESPGLEVFKVELACESWVKGIKWKLIYKFLKSCFEWKWRSHKIWLLHSRNTAPFRWMLTHCCSAYEVYSENNGHFRFLKKIIYLFIYINVVAFKIVPIRYYALVPALFPILETLLKFDLWDSL